MDGKERLLAVYDPSSPHADIDCEDAYHEADYENNAGADSGYYSPPFVARRGLTSTASNTFAPPSRTASGQLMPADVALCVPWEKSPVSPSNGATLQRNDPLRDNNCERQTEGEEAEEEEEGGVYHRYDCHDATSGDSSLEPTAVAYTHNDVYGGTAFPTTASSNNNSSYDDRKTLGSASKAVTATAVASLPSSVSPESSSPHFDSLTDDDSDGNSNSEATPADLDDFLTWVYHYYSEKGYACLILSRVVHLVMLLFTAFFSTFLLGFVDWPKLLSCDSAETCAHVFGIRPNFLVGNRPTPGEVFVIFYFVLFMLYWIWNVMFFATKVLSRAQEMREFFHTRLSMSDEDLSTAEWDTVVQRIVDVQDTVRLCRLRSLTALDITNRIMRTENYFLALFATRTFKFSAGGGDDEEDDAEQERERVKKQKKKEKRQQAKKQTATQEMVSFLQHENKPVGGNNNVSSNNGDDVVGAPNNEEERMDDDSNNKNTAVSQQGLRQWLTNVIDYRHHYGTVLDWNLRSCILHPLFDRITFTLRPEARGLAGIRHLRCRLLWMGIINLLMMPFILLFMVVFFILQNAEELHSTKRPLGPRQFTLLAQYKLREFGELQHYFHRRLAACDEHAQAYLDQFPAPCVAVIAHGVAYVSGSLAAVLLFLSLSDSYLLLSFRIWDRTLLWYLALFTILLGASRALVPAKGTVFRPQMAMERVAMRSHYFPRRWVNNCHREPVRAEFAQMYKPRVLVFLGEVVSALLVPYVLIGPMRKHAGRIVTFIERISVTTNAMGQLCAFATFDLERFGDPTYFMDVPDEDLFEDQRRRVDRGTRAIRPVAVDGGDNIVGIGIGGGGGGNGGGDSTTRSGDDYGNGRRRRIDDSDGCGIDEDIDSDDSSDSDGAERDHGNPALIDLGSYVPPSEASVLPDHDRETKHTQEESTTTVGRQLSSRATTTTAAAAADTNHVSITISAEQGKDKKQPSSYMPTADVTIIGQQKTQPSTRNHLLMPPPPPRLPMMGASSNPDNINITQQQQQPRRRRLGSKSASRYRNRYTACAEQGKLEKSFINFAQHHPTWRAPNDSCIRYLRSLTAATAAATATTQQQQQHRVSSAASTSSSSLGMSNIADESISSVAAEPRHRRTPSLLATQHPDVFALSRGLSDTNRQIFQSMLAPTSEHDDDDVNNDSDADSGTNNDANEAFDNNTFSGANGHSVRHFGPHASSTLMPLSQFLLPTQPSCHVVQQQQSRLLGDDRSRRIDSDKAEQKAAIAVSRRYNIPLDLALSVQQLPDDTDT